MTQPAMIPFNPVIPLHGDVTSFAMLGPFQGPMEYNGWRAESQSWKDGAYLGAAITWGPAYTVKGPDAERFFSDTFVNDFPNMPVGGFRHAIACDTQGRIMTDGVVLRVAQDDFYTCWLAPYVDYAFGKGSYDAVGEDLTGRRFLFQVAGPRSLEILERTAGADLHDIGFGRHRMTRMAGADVRVFRLGMAGSLAYEVHGDIVDGQDVFNAIWEAGRGYGLQKLGQVAYMLNHTEDGFPQANYHFPYPWYEDPGFAAYLDTRPGAGWMNFRPRLFGSMGEDVKARYMTPFDTGWENRINWDHDFVGKEALLEMAKAPRRTVVTLEWNTEDVVDVYASQFRDEEPYEPISDRPNDIRYDPGTLDQATGQIRTFAYHADKVMKDGREVGLSSGRAVSQTYRRMISLGFIERDLAELSAEVVVIWGSPGWRQKEIRATVARFPYLQVERNDQVDVEKIPRLAV
ncbi:MAG: aminomethyl transferase family protein [Thermoleophilia bacterium]|nr:aminomethyl transferase family protein [Thermoleophilia bacterium]